jgi:hypothetical protein
MSSSPKKEVTRSLDGFGWSRSRACSCTYCTQYVVRAIVSRRDTLLVCPLIRARQKE